MWHFNIHIFLNIPWAFSIVQLWQNVIACGARRCCHGCGFTLAWPIALLWPQSLMPHGRFGIVCKKWRQTQPRQQAHVCVVSRVINNSTGNILQHHSSAATNYSYSVVPAGISQLITSFAIFCVLLLLLLMHQRKCPMKRLEINLILTFIHLWKIHSK